MSKIFANIAQSNVCTKQQSHFVDISCIEFRLCETFAVINSKTRIILIEILYKFRTIKC